MEPKFPWLDYLSPELWMKDLNQQKHHFVQKHTFTGKPCVIYHSLRDKTSTSVYALDKLVQKQILEKDPPALCSACACKYTLTMAEGLLTEGTFSTNKADLVWRKDIIIVFIQRCNFTWYSSISIFIKCVICQCVCKKGKTVVFRTSLKVWNLMSFRLQRKETAWTDHPWMQQIVFMCLKLLQTLD